MTLKEKILFFWIFSMVIATTVTSHLLGHWHSAMEGLLACGISFFMR
jgi:hypothetical protein